MGVMAKVTSASAEGHSRHHKGLTGHDSVWPCMQMLRNEQKAGRGAMPATRRHPQQQSARNLSGGGLSTNHVTFTFPAGGPAGEGQGRLAWQVTKSITEGARTK